MIIQMTRLFSGTEAYNSNVEVIDDPTNSEKGKIISYYYPQKRMQQILNQKQMKDW